MSRTRPGQGDHAQAQRRKNAGGQQGQQFAALRRRAGNRQAQSQQQVVSASASSERFAGNPGEHAQQQQCAARHAQRHQQAQDKTGLGIAAVGMGRAVTDRQPRLTHSLDDLADKLRVGMDHIGVFGQPERKQADIADPDVALAGRAHKTLHGGRLLHVPHFIRADAVHPNRLRFGHAGQVFIAQRFAQFHTAISQAVRVPAPPPSL